MSAAYEEDLHERAAALAGELPGLADDVLAAIAAARRAGLDPDAVRPVAGAALALGASRMDVRLAGRTGPGAKFAGEQHFLSAVAGTADDAARLLAAADALARTVTGAMNSARADRKKAPPRSPRWCEADERVRACQVTRRLLNILAGNLGHAIARLDDVPAAPGETREAPAPRASLLTGRNQRP